VTTATLLLSRAEKVTPMSLETPEELVELAMDARRLARVIGDAKAIDELRRLATQYEQKAVEMRNRNRQGLA
jgi:hypothetical protein